MISSSWGWVEMGQNFAKSGMKNGMASPANSHAPTWGLSLEWTVLAGTMAQMMVP